MVRGSRAFPPTVAGRARAAGVGGGVAGGGAGTGRSRGGSEKGLGRGVRRLKSVVGSPYYVAPEVRICRVVVVVTRRRRDAVLTPLCMCQSVSLVVQM